MNNITNYANELNKQRRNCCLYNVQQMPYKIAWEWQRSLVAERINNPHVDDTLILLEHPPVYTLGQGASLDFIKFDLNHTKQEVHRIERGGEVTYHCPGQLVGYPILNLRYYQQDLHWYLRQLEEVLIRVLLVYGLEGYRITGMTGVWAEDRKVAAIGIKVSKWITMHGFSLNICPDLRGFEQIIPCGIANKAVGSLEQLIPGIDFNQVRQQVAVAFAEVFNVELVKTN